MLPTIRVLLALSGLGVVTVGVATCGLVSPPEFPTEIGEVPSIGRPFIQEAMAPRLAIEARGDFAEERIPVMEVTGMATGGDAQLPPSPALSADADDGGKTTGEIQPSGAADAHNAQREDGTPAGSPPTLALDDEDNGRNAAPTRPEDETAPPQSSAMGDQGTPTSASAGVALLPPERPSFASAIPPGAAADDRRRSGADGQNSVASRPYGAVPRTVVSPQWRRTPSAPTRRRGTYAVAPRSNRNIAATTRRSGVTATNPDQADGNGYRLYTSGTDE